MRNRCSERVCQSTAIALSLWLGSSHPYATGQVFDRDLLVQRLGTAGAPLRGYRALRRLSASTRRGAISGSLDAWTTLDSDTGLTFEIVREEGSGVIRSRVLHAALGAERDLVRSGNAIHAAISPLNYDFLDVVDASDGLVRLDIRPKRRDQLLVEGSILVDGDTADIVQVGGLLAKPPSFWTRRVRVERRYARIGGVHVPVSMTSTADVLVVGQSSFTMSYCYAEINGVSVASCDD